VRRTHGWRVGPMTQGRWGGGEGCLCAPKVEDPMVVNISSQWGVGQPKPWRRRDPRFCFFLPHSTRVRGGAHGWARPAGGPTVEKQEDPRLRSSAGAHECASKP
jgi:hypothetical protein